MSITYYTFYKRAFHGAYLLFFLLFSFSVGAQTDGYIKDSLLLEKTFKSIDIKYVKDIDETSKNLRQALQLAKKLSLQYPEKPYFISRQADILSNLGFANIQKGDLALALKRLTKVIRLKKQIGHSDETAHAYYLMGIVWNRYLDYDKTKKYYDSAYAITERNINNGLPQYKFKATLLNLYGCHYANMDSLQKAYYYFEKAIRLADSLGEKDTEAMNSLQYAEVLHYNHDYKKAFEYRKRAQRLFQETNNKVGEVDMLSELAESYNVLGQTEKALELMRQNIAYYKDKNLDGELLLEYPLYISILESNKRYAEGFNIQQEYIQLKDSLRNKSNYKKLATLEANMNKSMDSLNVVNQFKIKEIESEKKANTKFWLVVSVLLVLLSFLTIFYIIYRNRAREQALKNQLLNQKVSEKTEEITELLTETIHHIKQKERIAENLQKLSTEQDGITLKSIMADLKASKADHAKLMLIKQNIEQVNFEFIKKLRTLHPELTKTDIEICSFVRIGLSRKEIANLRNTSLEAIKSSRFRIKRKLNLPTDHSLDDYINTL